MSILLAWSIEFPWSWELEDRPRVRPEDADWFNKDEEAGCGNGLGVDVMCGSAGERNGPLRAMRRWDGLSMVPFIV
jgi:hypothetical protein